MMKRGMRCLVVFLTSVGLASCGDNDDSSSECRNPATTSGAVKLTPFGCPSWKFVDAQIFSADIGAGGENFLTTALSLVTPSGANAHRLIDAFGVGPGDAHAGPYDHELNDGLTRNGFTSTTTFDEASFHVPKAVLVVLMGVPAEDAPHGKSPDFASGPVIANSVYPMELTGALYKDGQLWDPNWGFGISKLGDVVGDSTLDGYSHMPMFFADNVDFAGHGGDDPSGVYDLILTFVDATHQGWVVEAPFVVQ